MTIRMQPGDWIAKEDIRDEDHLECIREAVRVQGYRVGFYEYYGSNHRSSRKWLRNSPPPSHRPHWGVRRADSGAGSPGSGH